MTDFVIKNSMPKNQTIQERLNIFQQSLEERGIVDLKPHSVTLEPLLISNHA